MIITIINKHLLLYLRLYIELYILVLGIYYNCVYLWNDIFYILKKMWCFKILNDVQNCGWVNKKSNDFGIDIDIDKSCDLQMSHMTTKY